MLRSMSVVGAFCSFLLLTASSAFADTIVVREGDDLQTALDGAGPGDTILLGPGQFDGGLVLAAGRDGLTIRGKGKTFIDGPQIDPTLPDIPPALVIESAGVTLTNLRFRHSTRNVIEMGSAPAPLDGLRVERCHFLGGRGKAILVFGNDVSLIRTTFRGQDDGVIEMTGNNLVVERCTARQLGNFGYRLFGNGLRYVKNVLKMVEDGQGIDVEGNDVLVERSRFFNIQREHVFTRGTDTRVIRCRMDLGDLRAINLSGDRSVVERNRLGVFAATPISVLGRSVRVAGNRLRTAKDSSFDGDFFGNLPNNEGNPDCRSDDGLCDTDGSAIVVWGDDAEVEDNSVQDSQGRGIRVYGAAPMVMNNFVGSTRSRGLDVAGDGAVVIGNTVFAGDAGIGVTGDDVRVERNTVRAAGDDSTGMFITGERFSVLSNRINEANGPGMSVFGSDGTVGYNVVTECGAEDEGGIRMNGDRNTTIGNRVSGCDGPGLWIDGFDNTVRENVSSDNSDDGIRLDSGHRATDLKTGNVLADNVCRGNGGEGIENEGAGTVIRGNLLRGNRIDLTNKTGLGATLVDQGGNRFGTGGLDVEPETNAWF